jgi:hypothetical protein
VQWSNGCRQRLYLSRPRKANEDEAPPEADRDKRILEVLKSNWGPQGAGVKLQWNDWFFTAEGEDLMVDVMSAEAKRRLSVVEMERAEREFMRMMKKAASAGMVVSPQPTSRNNAATLFARDPTFTSCQFRGSSGYKLLAQAMLNLINKGRLKNAMYGPPSHLKTHIVAAD